MAAACGQLCMSMQCAPAGMSAALAALQHTRSSFATLRILKAVEQHLLYTCSREYEAELYTDVAMCVAFCRTLNALMRYGTVVQACVAAALYSWLLRAPGAPVSLLGAQPNSIQICACCQKLLLHPSWTVAAAVEAVCCGSAAATHKQHAAMG